jgi:uncharacterized protein (UPF0333 family)
MFKKHKENERGQGLLEYALIIVLVAVVVIVVLAFTGDPVIMSLYCRAIEPIQNVMSNNTSTACAAFWTPTP